jgi:2-polyprenyl-6-methoxyphenol hydroxylase-like FAD-dependent oxidoreductase
MKRKRAVSKIVLTVGGGVAGPALGIALRRIGIDSVVYAAAPQPRDYAGAFLHLAPQGLRALRRLDLQDRVAELGFVNQQMGGITVPRGALSRLLREIACEAGVRFEYEKELLSVLERDGGAGARFADGTRVTGRLLVGADGIHSATRRSLFPDAPDPVYAGVTHAGGVVTTDLEPTDNQMHMLFRRDGLFGFAVRPDGETHWCCSLSLPGEPTGDLRPRLSDTYAADPTVRRVLAAVDGAIAGYPVYDMAALPRWSCGPVCLIGDAAHGVGPQVEHGASLALEDAVTLAGCLDEESDPATAFANFEGMRRAQLSAA